MYHIVYSVGGNPAPQGSKTRTRYGMRDSSKNLKPWRDAVHKASMEQAQLTDAVHGPFAVSFLFRIQEPRRPQRWYPPLDIDKLCRSTLDGMTTGGIIDDDKHCVTLKATKEYHPSPGVIIKIEPLK